MILNCAATPSSNLKPTAFLISASLHQARLTAEMDWKWERASFDTYRTEEGELVKITSNVFHLRGCPIGTRIYLGYQWFRCERHEELLAMIEAKFFTVVKDLYVPR